MLSPTQPSTGTQCSGGISQCLALCKESKLGASVHGKKTPAFISQLETVPVAEAADRERESELLDNTGQMFT